MVTKDLLAAVPLFSRCTGRELSRIARLASKVSVSAGSVVVQEGTVGDRFYVIVAGSALVTIGGREIARLDAGGFFGEVALLDTLPRTATVIATTPMTLYMVEAADFGRFLEESPDVLLRILRAATERLRAAEGAPNYAASY